MKTSKCNLNEPLSYTTAVFFFTASTNALTSEFCLHQCFCNSCAPCQCLFLYGKRGVSQNSNPSLSVNGKYFISILCRQSHTNKKLLLIQDEAVRKRNRNKSKVSCLEQMVTAVSDLADQSLQAVRWQICTFMFCYHLHGQWHSRIHCSVTHRQKLSCTGCLKRSLMVCLQIHRF